MDSKKILIIGLDGATWDILLPLIKDNKLPALKRLTINGSYGVLKSTIPPVTGGAWLSLATGRTPGKTGIIDFLKKCDSSSTRLCPVSSKDFIGRAFWDYLSCANKRVGIFEYPMLYPPYKINGFMTSSEAFSLGKDNTYPPSLKKELELITKNYITSVNYHSKKYKDESLLIEDLNKYLEGFKERIIYLIRNKKWDLLFAVFLATDWIQHAMWKHIDENHILYNPKMSLKYREEFILFWQKVDKMIGDIMDIIPENTIIFLVSDHGFGPNDQTFNLAKWLELKGYLKRRNKLRAMIAKQLIFIVSKILRNRLKFKSNITINIDLKKSKAYCLGHTIPFGAIYINANDLKERDKIKSKIVEDLKNISEDINCSVSVQIYDPKKIYFGDKVNLLPDIIFTINNWRCVIIEDSFKKPLFKNEPFSIRHTGSHRPDGIVLVCGPGIKKNNRINAEIYDIAPTILHIFDLPIPRDIDGKVLTDLFEGDSDFVKKRPKYTKITYYSYLNEKQKIKMKIDNIKIKKRL